MYSVVKLFFAIEFSKKFIRVLADVGEKLWELIHSKASEANLTT